MRTATRWLRPKPFAVPPAETPSEERLLRDMGRRIRAYRKAKGWNQTELGRRVGRRQETVSRWENGEVEMTLLEAVSVARTFGVSLDALVRGR